jgi:hypothetical protein
MSFKSARCSVLFSKYEIQKRYQVATIPYPATSWSLLSEWLQKRASKQATSGKAQQTPRGE